MGRGYGLVVCWWYLGFNRVEWVGELWAKQKACTEASFLKVQLTKRLVESLSCLQLAG